MRAKIVPDGCMIAFSGEIINLMEPKENTYTIEDIAHGLAFNCRWNGATKRYFSIAEHCCQMFDYFYKRGLITQAKTALFHDAEEAYWGDMIKPLKNLMPPEVREAMRGTRNEIFNQFDVAPICGMIKDIDYTLLIWDLDNLIKSGS